MLLLLEAMVASVMHVTDSLCYLFRANQSKSWCLGGAISLSILIENCLPVGRPGGHVVGLVVLVCT